MNTKLIISLKEVERALESRGRVLRQKGIDTRGLLEFSFLATQKQDFQDIQRHIEKDVYDVYPELFEDFSNYRKIVHNCFDYVIEGAHYLAPLLQRVTGQQAPTLDFDYFHGSAAVVSFKHDM